MESREPHFSEKGAWQYHFRHRHIDWLLCFSSWSLWALLGPGHQDAGCQDSHKRRGRSKVQGQTSKTLPDLTSAPPETGAGSGRLGAYTWKFQTYSSLIIPLINILPWRTYSWTHCCIEMSWHKNKVKSCKLASVNSHCLPSAKVSPPSLLSSTFCF